jgi:hypothetical protein
MALCLVSGALAVGSTAEPQPPDAKASKISPARLKGMKAAIADIEAGKLKQKLIPPPAPPWWERYVELLKKECGVGLDLVTGKTTEELLAGMKGYNDVMRAEIEHRFGRDILNKLGEKAEAEYRKSKEKK